MTNSAKDLNLLLAVTDQLGDYANCGFVSTPGRCHLFFLNNAFKKVVTEHLFWTRHGTSGGAEGAYSQLGRQGMYTKVWGDKQKPGLNLSHQDTGCHSR